jgi:hypothetical protein
VLCYTQRTVKKSLYSKILVGLLTAVLPRLFRTATQYLERQSIATHVGLLDKKSSSINKKYFYLLLNIILQKNRSFSHNEACVIGALVCGHC